MTDKLPIERLEEIELSLLDTMNDIIDSYDGPIKLMPEATRAKTKDILQAMAALRELISIRKAQPLLWRSALREIEDSAEVFGPYAGEMVRCVIDSVANSLEELVGDGELVIIKT